MTLGTIWQDYLAAAAWESERSLARPRTAYPHYSENGHWVTLDIEHRSAWNGNFYDHGNWTAGFRFGVTWLLALGSSDAKIARLAHERLADLSTRADDATTHDLGFLFYPSFALGMESGFVTRQEAGPALTAARMMVRRYNACGDYIQAFGPIGDSRSAGTSTIDTMMNLPLLWWAFAYSLDPAIYEVARRHARTSARLFLRDDASTYHLSTFNQDSGAIVRRGTYQGAGDTSCWSRGQAWALCGFAWSYAATGEVEFLTAAERVGSYFWAHLPADGVVPWDFSDTSPHAARDASASAIAALGALILGYVHPDPDAAMRHDRLARALLGRLGDAALNRDEHIDGILLHSCYSWPHRLGLDGATAWGDFYFGLALAAANGCVDLRALASTARTLSEVSCHG